MPSEARLGGGEGRKPGYRRATAQRLGMTRTKLGGLPVRGAGRRRAPARALRRRGTGSSRARAALTRPHPKI